jgi:hypothetical protein
MHIEFRRTGGFASPATDLNHVDESSLTAAEKTELMGLVEAAAKSPASAPAGTQHPGSPDAMSYRVAIDTGKHQLAFNGSMPQIPDAAQPLVRWLESHAQRKTSGT